MVYRVVLVNREHPVPLKPVMYGHIDKHRSDEVDAAVTR